jgi:hypothetical protein
VTSNIQNELSEEDKKYQRLTELNDQRLQAGTISEAEHSKRKLEIEAQHDARTGSETQTGNFRQSTCYPRYCH